MPSDTRRYKDVSKMVTMWSCPLATDGLIGYINMPFPAPLPTSIVNFLRVFITYLFLKSLIHKITLVTITTT
jgi:hypothetical protein